MSLDTRPTNDISEEPHKNKRKRKTELFQKRSATIDIQETLNGKIKDYLHDHVVR